MAAMLPRAATVGNPPPHSTRETMLKRSETRVAEGREFVLLVTSIMAMGALAIDLMLPAFPAIRVEYGMAPGSPEVGWMITTFFLGLAIGPWFFGPPSDRYGRKPMLYIGLGLYAVGALGAVLAPTYGLLIASRFVWGLGAGAPRSLALAIIRDRYEGEQMARLMSMIMATFILVPIVAPSLGSLMMQVAPWRIVFWIPLLLSGALALWARRLPETLTAGRRRPFTRAGVTAAMKAVVENTTTVCFAIAIAFLFGVMTGYLSSSELIVEGVYGYGKWFPLFFGFVAILLGLGSLTSARFVSRVGLMPWIGWVSRASIATAAGFAALVLLTDGRPNFWVMTVALALLMPTVQGLVPNCNTAAMAPVPHVAGTAAAIIGTVTTAGGSLLGGYLTKAFDDTVRPFALGVLLYVGIAFVFITIGRRAYGRSS